MSDPLVYLLLAVLLMFAIVLPQRLGNWALWLRAAWAIGIFIGLTLLLRQLVGSPMRPHFDTGQPVFAFWEKVIEAGWWFMAARGAIWLMRLVVVLEHRPRETQIISDLVAGGIYITAGLAIVDYVFAVPIGGLLATSGIIAIVLGLALQSTLADVFSGIAVGVERPYRAGDLIWVEGDIEGQVLQVTWRSTQIATGQNNIAIVPNSIIAKARIINRSRPTMVRGAAISVRLDPAVAPELCQAALIAAAKSCNLVLTAPPPEVACTSLSGDGSVYQLSFFVAGSGVLSHAQHELLSEVHRHLRHAGIGLAVAGTAPVAAAPPPSPAQLLEQSDLFGVIEQEQRDQLASHFQTVYLQPGETLIEQGGEPEALFVLASGATEITVTEASGPRVVAHLRPGESLGAIGLITGAPYGATATALTAVKAYRLDKGCIADAIKAQPALAKGLEVIAERGRAALAKDAAAMPHDRLGESEMFLNRLRHLIHVLQSRSAG